MKKIISILTIFLFCTCSVDEERMIESPSISIINPTQELYNIGQIINIDILISHNEVIDNITYYETCNCTDDEFDSLELIELKNVYEKEWSYTKNIDTSKTLKNYIIWTEPVRRGIKSIKKSSRWYRKKYRSIRFYGNKNG